MVVRGAAVVPLLLRLLRVPCFPEGLVGVGRIAPPRGLISSSVGAFGVSAAWVLVGMVVVVAWLLGYCFRWGFFLLWVSGCEDLGCPPCGGHDVQWGG